MVCCPCSTALLACWLVFPLFLPFRSTLRCVDARSIPVLGCGPSRVSSSRTTRVQAKPTRAETRSHERTIAHQPDAEGSVSRVDDFRCDVSRTAMGGGLAVMRAYEVSRSETCARSVRILTEPLRDL